MAELIIEGRHIGVDHPTYFIADISANHDGVLDRALKLIALAKDAGADAAKFQSFSAETIVSAAGFESLSVQLSHQSRWKSSVIDVYRAASIPDKWVPLLKAECDRVGIHFFSTPYAFDKVEQLDQYVSVYKIGSGDITWTELIDHIAAKGKPVLLACGASDMTDVERAMEHLLRKTDQVALMQCNTNYTGSAENFRYVQLRVLATFARMYPKVVLGLSDHTPGHATVLGAVALGARVVEKHFTDDTSREGPDHPFSMDPTSWRDMVDRTRELEMALGGFVKRVEPNEKETIVVQRRCIRAVRDIAIGTVITRELVEMLRPAPAGSLAPFRMGAIVGQKTRRSIRAGEALSAGDFE